MKKYEAKEQIRRINQVLLNVKAHNYTTEELHQIINNMGNTLIEGFKAVIDKK